MGLPARMLVALLAACGCCALLSLGQLQRLLAVSWASPAAPQVDERTRKLLAAFPESVRALENRLLSLEHSIQEAAASYEGDAELDAPAGAAALGAASAPGPAAGGASGRAATGGAAKGAAAEAAAPHWRQDNKCGKKVPALANGQLVGCNPAGQFPCCSALGWCGATPDHCQCTGCVDYKSSPLMLARNATVLVVIPFRDREGHLVNFRKYWRWFAKAGRKPPTVTRWEVFVVEQFDAQAFNRGWNFNAGVAIASAQTSASPEITSDMGIDFDCAVIQDIDYLPEEGVDYADCEVPMQLSSEIDRYHWKTPYVQSAGGIVGMNLKHWRRINGFGNDYYGWGGEDDELFHRLRLNNLLLGDCYPFCVKDDPSKGKPGKSIKRPRKGFGRFSGKFMHSANHTKRITDSKAYARNIKMLQEIQNNGDRWKSDGLSNVAFRIVGRDTDRTDSAEYGITYHHIRVHRGKADFNLLGLPLAVPASICDGAPSAEGALRKAKSWSLYNFRATGGVPWDLAALRDRVATLSAPSGGTCRGAATASFLLLDRRRHLAKVLADDDPRLLLVFYRSFNDPASEGLIIADPRPKAAIHDIFTGTSAFMAPPSEYRVCTSPLKEEGPKYSVHQGPTCSGGGWDHLQGGSFRGHAKERPGLQAVSFCDNEKHWVQRIVAAKSCERKWAGLKWTLGGTFWVPSGRSFCVGTRTSSKEGLSFSRLLAQPRCDGDSFSQDFGFDSVPAEAHTLPALTICIGLGLGGSRMLVSSKGSCDEAGVWQRLVSFPARIAVAAGEEDRLLCVEKVSDEIGDVVREAGSCGPGRKLTFAVPKNPRQDENVPTAARRLLVCIFPPDVTEARRAVVGSECKAASGAGVLRFEAPSLLDLLASMPGAGGKLTPLYSVVEEEIPCFGFLCPNILKG